LEDKNINRLISITGSCHLSNVESLRRLYTQGNKYDYQGVSIECDETNRATPEFVKFKLGFPLNMLGISENNPQSDIMTADYCLRRFSEYLELIRLSREHATGKEKYSGRIYIYEPNQKIITRNTSYIKDEVVYISVTIRFALLMASKRNVVNGDLSVKILHKYLARSIRDFIKFFNVKDYKAQERIYKRQQEIRGMLKGKGLISFIANGSILPRNEIGKALRGAVPFKSPREDEIAICLSDGYIIKGMGVKEGVTVITGGGYSGKSTLLDAMLHGIYDHIPGDGREYCITLKNVCKIIAEDGRSVTSLDISPFIRSVSNLKTTSFTTKHASGSTSQASNIMEAIAFGCGAMLIDEDRTATNFMIRDARMKKIIKDDPIVPFTDRVRQIYKDTGISTVLIIGGSSEYLDLADNVYIMRDYIIYNYNKEVAQTKENNFDFFSVNDSGAIKWRLERIILKEPMMSFKKADESNKIREFIDVTDEEIYVGTYKANISRLDTIISRQQMIAITFIIRSLFNNQKDKKCWLLQEIQSIYDKILENGFDDIFSTSFGVDFNMELPAMHDILFSLSRMNNIIYE